MSSRAIGPRATRPRVSQRWVWGAVALCIAVRLPFITVPLNIDEGGDAMVAREWIHTHGSIYGQYWLDRPPLLVGLYRVALSAGGDLGIRALGMLAAVGLVIAVMRLADLVAGDRAAKLAGVITALLVGSMISGAALSDAELLGALPATLSIIALIAACRATTHRKRALFAAGMLAAAAVLIKQSFLDAPAAGLVMLAVAALRRDTSGFRPSWAATYVGGLALLPVLCLAWAGTVSVGVRPFLYAMWGFRVDAVRALQHSSQSPWKLLVVAGIPFAIATGTALLLPWAIAYLARTARRNVLEVSVLATWCVVGVVGVAGGGHFFGHYFIQLVPVLAVLAAAGIATRSHARWLERGTIGCIALLAILNLVGGGWLLHAAPPQQRVLSIARYLRDTSTAGDSVYVMYARANLAYHSGLPAPFPYEWSLMMYAIPSAEPELRTWLASDDRPTWVVEWQAPTAFGLDRDGETRRLLASHYRQVSTVCGKPIMLRIDRPAPRRGAAADCRSRVPVLGTRLLDTLWA